MLPEFATNAPIAKEWASALASIVASIISFAAALIVAVIAVRSSKATLEFQSRLSERQFKERQFHDLRQCLSLLLYLADPQIELQDRNSAKDKAIAEAIVLLDPAIVPQAALEAHLLRMDTIGDSYKWRDEYKTLLRAALNDIEGSLTK
jgi:hypothetical protein